MGGEPGFRQISSVAKQLLWGRPKTAPLRWIEAGKEFSGRAVAGRAVAGRAVAGRAVAGREVAGRKEPSEDAKEGAPSRRLQQSRTGKPSSTRTNFTGFLDSSSHRRKNEFVSSEKRFPSPTTTIDSNSDSTNLLFSRTDHSSANGRSTNSRSTNSYSVNTDSTDAFRPFHSFDRPISSSYSIRTNDFFRPETISSSSSYSSPPPSPSSPPPLLRSAYGAGSSHGSIVTNRAERFLSLATSRYRYFGITLTTRHFSTSSIERGPGKTKYTFDEKVGSDPLDPQGRLTSINEVAVFEHFNAEGRRLPRVYVWGSTKTGALGCAHFLHPRKPKVKGEYWQRAERAKKLKAPDPVYSVTRPFRIPHPDYFDLNISHVAAGHGFTVMVNDQKKAKAPKVIGTGLNYESQLGYVRVTDKKTGEEKIIDMLLEPTDISLPLTDMTHSKVKQVSCGRAHSVFVTDEGVFTMGSNSQGQCGRKVIEGEIFRGNAVVHKIDSIPDPVVSVVCGLDHTLFLTSLGTVYACGWGADGQTGLGHYGSVDVPTLVKGDIEGVKVKQLACKADCVLAVSDRGDLFGWGNSEYNQLSLVTPSTQVRHPRHLPFSVGRVSVAAAGASACVLLNELGQVFVWGYGILGLGPNVDSLTEPQMLPPPLFGLSPLTPNLKVVDVVAGLSHFAAIVETPKKILDSRTRREIPPFRELYTWGADRGGCLGLRREENQLFPLKVILPASVNQVACGSNHTVALCDPLLV